MSNCPYVENEKGPLKTAVIVGAGFSRTLGVPAYDGVMKYIAKDLSEEFGQLTQLQKKIDKEITTHIGKFLEDVFYYYGKSCMPSLEQIFTFIDLSANTGHNLGQNYTPGKLRALRRFLIYKLFLIIDKRYKRENSHFIGDFLKKLNASHYISLNWDIVLEQCIDDFLHKDKIYTYGVNEIQVEINKEKRKFEKRHNSAPSNGIDRIKIAKVHGSANWAYCDNCKKIFYLKDETITKTFPLSIYVEDIKKFYKPGANHENKDLNDLISGIRQEKKSKECPECKCSLGSHIATFSYNKSFRTHAFNASWGLAEKILSDSERWFFIGYSLPIADFEFAHMLKCEQIRTKPPKKIIVINCDRDDTIMQRYYSTFGINNVDYHNEGLENFVKNELEGIESRWAKLELSIR